VKLPVCGRIFTVGDSEERERIKENAGKGKAVER
jgi:hypothetical protein